MKKLSLLAIAAAATVLVSCGNKGGRPNFGDNEFPVQEVTTVSASMQTTYPATIKGIHDVEIRPKVSGFLVQINVHEGQTVSAGQTLFVIDNATYQAAVRQARAAMQPKPDTGCYRHNKMFSTQTKRVLTKSLTSDIKVVTIVFSG